MYTMKLIKCLLFSFILVSCNSVLIDLPKGIKGKKISSFNSYEYIVTIYLLKSKNFNSEISNEKNIKCCCKRKLVSWKKINTSFQEDKHILKIIEHASNQVPDSSLNELIDSFGKDSDIYFSSCYNVMIGRKSGPYNDYMKMYLIDKKNEKVYYFKAIIDRVF